MRHAKICAIVASLFLSLSVGAQTAAAWETECKTDAMTDARSCMVSYLSRFSESVITFAVTKPEGNWMFTVTVAPHPPMGYILKCALRVDKTPAVWGENDNIKKVCVFRFRLSDFNRIDTDAIMANLKAGESLFVRVTFLWHGDWDTAIPLAGFREALTRAGW